MNTQDRKTRARIVKERKKRRIAANIEKTRLNLGKKNALSRIFNKTTAVAAFTFVSNMFSANAPKSYASETAESTSATEAFVNTFTTQNFSRFSGDIELDKKSSLETLMMDKGVSPEITTELKKAFGPIANLEEISGNNFSYEIVQSNKDNQIARATIKYKLKTTTKKSNLPKIKNDREFTVYGYTDKDGGCKYYSQEGVDANDGLRLPLDDKYIDISSPFDLKRFHPVKKKIIPHYGMDLRADRGTPVRAASDGVIKFRGIKDGYGNVLELDNGKSIADEDISTVYGHLNRFAVKEGQKVKKGEIIGYVGNTGIGTGFHLHYEVRLNDVPVDPLGEKAARITFHKINEDKMFYLTVAGANSVSEQLESGVNFVEVSKLSIKPFEIEGEDVENKMIKDKKELVRTKLSQSRNPIAKTTPTLATLKTHKSRT